MRYGCRVRVGVRVSRVRIRGRGRVSRVRVSRVLGLGAGAGELEKFGRRVQRLGQGRWTLLDAGRRPASGVWRPGMGGCLDDEVRDAGRRPSSVQRLGQRRWTPDAVRRPASGIRAWVPGRRGTGRWGAARSLVREGREGGRVSDTNTSPFGAAAVYRSGRFPGMRR